MTNLRAAEDSTLRVQGLPTADNRWSVVCLNCDTLLHGEFCSNCGQRAVPPHPTVRELAGDALSEFTGWDGKFAETIRSLMLRPGQLTQEWLEGHRASYVAPLRMYLTASLLYFVVSAAAPNLTGRRNIAITETPIAAGKGSPSAPEGVAAAASRALTTKKALSPEEQAGLQAKVDKAPWFMKPMVKRSISDPAGFEATVRRQLPNVLFALLPAFALIISLFYRGRHYPEHLYFAIHLHTFTFIALMLGKLVAFPRIDSLFMAAQIGIMIWIPVYYLLAVRRVYGGSFGMNLLKAIGIGTLYCIAVVPAMFALVLIAAF
jgi:hypothetical protein